MRQLNVNVTPEFERDLKILMKKGGVPTKSHAVRQAVHEAAARVAAKKYDFTKWLGAGNVGPENKNRQFLTEDDLWS